MSKQNYINHVALVLDESSSMLRLKNKTIEVSDKIVSFLATKSEEMSQETRATVYTFAYTPKCVYFDMDVLRLPSIKNDYRPDGMTALVDATMLAISDLKQTATMYGDHAFVVYVVTDGVENQSTNSNLINIKRTIDSLGENWTMAVLVPDAGGKQHALKYGFPEGNIAIWNANSVEGVAAVGKQIEQATSTFMTNRTAGVRGTKSLFENVKVERLFMPTTEKYMFINVTSPPTGQPDWSIKEFMQAKMGFYSIGSAFYELVKPEKVQASKRVAILDKSTDTVYIGDEARAMIGLPNEEVRLHPESHPKYQLFVQSKSVTRKLPTGSKVLVLNA